MSENSTYRVECDCGWVREYGGTPAFLDYERRAMSALGGHLSNANCSRGDIRLNEVAGPTEEGGAR